MASSVTLPNPAVAVTSNVPAVIPRYVATDYDGTFASETAHAPTEKTKELYRLLRSRNVPVMFATGRPVYSLKKAMELRAPDLLADLKPFPGVYNHGAVVFGETQSEVIDCKLFGEAQIRYVCEKLYKIKAELMEQGLLNKDEPEFSVISYGVNKETVDWEHEAFDRFNRIYAEECEQIYNCRLDDDKVIDEVARETTHIAVAATRDILNKVWDSFDPKELAEKAGARLVIPAAEQLHFLRLDVDKGTGLKTLCAKYNYDSKALLCIGDGMNDIEMLSWAGTGVAMGNASDAVKKFAGFVTAKGSQEGWAQAVSQYTQQF